MTHLFTFHGDAEMATKRKAAVAKPKTVKCRILVAVDKEGGVLACNGDDACCYRRPGEMSDEEVVENAVFNADASHASQLTLRFIEVELPIPTPEEPAVKTLTVTDV